MSLQPSDVERIRRLLDSAVTRAHGLPPLCRPVLQFSDLQELCRPGEKPRLATVETWARKQGIRFRYDGKGGIWTTLDALNEALGVRPNREDEPYGADQLV